MLNECGWCCGEEVEERAGDENKSIERGFTINKSTDQRVLQISCAHSAPFHTARAGFRCAANRGGTCNHTLPHMVSQRNAARRPSALLHMVKSVLLTLGM